jgi:hypothetical protein
MAAFARAVDAEGGGSDAAAVEPVRMIDPPSLISGKAFWTVKRVPLTLTPKV